MTTSGVPIEDLLIHAEFVRSLARDLVRDPSAADDLAQEAWLHALRTPPRHGSSLRGWFATLLHNVARNRLRTERRRVARERLAAPLDVAVPTPEQILDRELVRERMVRAVLAMDEPFRSTLLLRYYEELPTPEIARRLGVAEATVRTRLSRGLERLRQSLDEQHEGRRDTWVVPLASWWDASSPPLAAAAGVLAMKKLVSTFAALVVLALIVDFAFTFTSRDDTPTPHETTVVASSSLPASSDANTSTTGDERTAATPDAYDARRLPVMPADRGIGAIVAELLDTHGAPVANVVVTARPSTGTLPPRMQMRDDRTASQTGRTDATGVCRIDAVPAGPTLVDVRLDDGRIAQQQVIVASGATEGPVLLQLEDGFAGDDVRVRVVDANGAAVADAEVEIFGWSQRPEFANRSEDPRREALAGGTTRDDGTASWRGLGVRSGCVWARRDGVGVGAVPFLLDGNRGREPLQLDVELGAPAGVRGVLVGADAASLRDAVLSLHFVHGGNALSIGGRCRDAPVRDGAFEFTDLPPGFYGATLRAPGGARLVVPTIGEGRNAIANSARMRVVQLARGAIAEARFEVAIGARLRGRVTTSGSPVAGARVRSVLAARTGNRPEGFVLRGVHVWRFDGSSENHVPDPSTHVDTVTDRDGRYEFTSLQPGEHRVEVVANGLTFDRCMDVELAAGAVVELTHELVACGVLQVASIGTNYVGVRPAGEANPAMIAVVPADYATFPGLRPGRWEVLRCHSGANVEPVVLGAAEVVAGRTTWLDLRTASVGAVITGTVTSGGMPVADAWVSRHPARARTDAFGTFRLTYGHPLAIGSTQPPAFERPLQVQRGSVRHDWTPASTERRTTFDAAIELGTRTLQVTVVDEHGAPVMARVRLDGDLRSSMPGVEHVAIEADVPAGGATFGPLPAWELRGAVKFTDGATKSLVIPPDATTWRVQRPVTVTVAAIVRQAGAAKSGVNVKACRWTGDGPAPDTLRAFGTSVEVHRGKTGADGTVQLQLPPGDYFVRASAILTPGVDVRVRVTADTPLVELELK